MGIRACAGGHYSSAARDVFPGHNQHVWGPRQHGNGLYWPSRHHYAGLWRHIRHLFHSPDGGQRHQCQRLHYRLRRGRNGSQYTIVRAPELCCRGRCFRPASGNIGNVGGFSVPISSVSINQALAGGRVYTYIPSTTSPKTTWFNADQASNHQNTNPVQLDANGCAIIYGIGSYQFVLEDSLGNIVYSQVTTDTSASNSVFWAGLAGGTPNAITLTDVGFNRHWRDRHQLQGDCLTVQAQQLLTHPTMVTYQSLSILASDLYHYLVARLFRIAFTVSSLIQSPATLY